MKRYLSAAALLLAFLLCLIGAVDAADRLTILHTNDTHSHMMPFDSKAYGPESGGIVRRAGLIEKIKKESPDLLVLDAGDILQGTPVYSIFKGEACYRAASLSGCEATTLGNHELDNDLANLQTQLATSGIRLLCCNVFYRDSKKPVFAPFHVFRRNGLKIGVIGSIGNEAWESIDRKIRAPMFQTDQTATARDTARRIRPYVDLVVLLSHAGIEFDMKLAAEVAEIDVLIGGHTHEEMQTPLLIEHKPEAGKYNNGLGGTIVAQAGEWGHFLGRIDLVIEKNHQIASWSGRLEKVTPEYEHLAPAELTRMVDDYNQRLESTMNEVIGQATSDLSFPKDLRKKSMLPMGTFTAASMRDAAGSDVGIINSGAIRSDLKAGKVTRGAVFEALPYDNSVVTFTMTGEALQNMLDTVAAKFGDPDGFQFYGLTGTLNLSTGKAENVLVDGSPIETTRNYRVSTSSFMANGNIAGDLLFAKIVKIEDSGILMRDAALKWLEKIRVVPDLSEAPVKIVRQ